MRLAVEHVRRMRGGAQSHLMRCDDGSFYVVKFSNNPQGSRILANEMFGTRLAARMGISVPDVDLIDVREALIKSTESLRMQLAIGRVPCSPGIQFGSKFPGDASKIKVYDLLYFHDAPIIGNVHDFWGILIFDKWTCNVDDRQAILVSQQGLDFHWSPTITFKAMMIDQGFCFGGSAWDFPDAPRRSMCIRRRVYENVQGIEAFEPWLDWLENRLSLDTLYEEAEKVPIEWYEGDQESWRNLIERLYARRTRVRELICSARNVTPDAFPNWLEGVGRRLAPPGQVRNNTDVTEEASHILESPLRRSR
jgi:hypothetical protein